MKKLTLFSLPILVMLLLISNRVSAAEAPYLPPIDDMTATIDEEFILDLNAVNANPVESYELLVARPGMTINQTTGLIQWTPSEPNEGGVVTVKAYNTVGESVRSFLIYLTDAVVCADDLVSYWKLDETTGNTYVDFKGGYTATALASLTDVAGQVSRAKQFTPLGTIDQAVYVQDEGQYDFARSGGFSVSMWVNYAGQHATVNNNQVLIARGSPTSDFDEMFMMVMINVDVNPSAPKITFSLRPRSTETVKSVTPMNVTIATNQWYHVVAVYDGPPNAWETTVMRVYINNVKNSFTHGFGPYDFTADGEFPLNIGYWDKYEGNRYPFNGAMDEILVYDKALSDSEISSIFNDGLAGQAHCRPGNYFPLITSTPDKSVLQDEYYDYLFTADDIDGDSVYLSAVDIPSWLDFDPKTGLLSGTPDQTQVGDHDISLLATDGTTDIYDSFTLTVDDVNDEPVFNSVPDTTAEEGLAYTYFVDATDPDEDDLIFDAEIIPSWLIFNPATKVLAGIPTRSDAGDNPVKLTVTDGEFTKEQSFIIKVKSGNSVPVITSIAPTTVDNYSDYMYNITAFDSDPADVLTFSAESIPAWLSFDPATQILSGTPEKSHVGNHNVILVVTDGYDVVKDEYILNVRDVNTAPVINSVANPTALVGQLYTYFLDAVDYDNDPLTLTGTFIPVWMTFDPTSRVLSGTPTEAELGPHTVLITVSDGPHTVIDQFSVQVAYTTGIDQEQSLVSKVYPNPANDYLVFELKNSASVIEIADLSGKVVKMTEVNEGEMMIRMDVSDLSNGFYMFKVVNGDQSQKGKIVIQ